MSAYKTFRDNLYSKNIEAADLQLAEHPELLFGKYGERLQKFPFPFASMKWLRVQALLSSQLGQPNGSHFTAS